MIVYKITCAVTGKAYVGITCKTLDRRWAMHLNSAGKKRKTRALYAAMAKHGIESFLMETICLAGSLAELKMLEQRYIAELGTLAPGGYNLTLGGDGVTGYRHSDEARARHAERHRGYRHTQATIEKIRASSSGRVIPREAVDRQLAKRRGAKRTAEQRARISSGRLGKGLGNQAGRRFAQGVVLAAMERLTNGERQMDVAAATGISPSHLSKLASGKRPLPGRSVS